MNLLNKVKTNFYWIPALLMVGSALLKFVHTSLSNSLYKTMGLNDNLIYLGVIELTSAVFYLFKPTMLIGFFLICVFWGGVIGISIVTQSSGYLPIGMLFLFGVSLYWREPALFSMQNKINQSLNL